MSGLAAAIPITRRMSNTGKQLEALIAFVEQLHLPSGFKVLTNNKEYQDGVQIAEFDIEIKGKLGTTEIHWLIECRDRPGSGPAPASWIEQLVGRRGRFNFSKVTAVSTTGFSPGAAKYASDEGIEMREVTSIVPDQFGWLRVERFPLESHLRHLTKTIILISADESVDRREAFSAAIREKGISDSILYSTKDKRYVSPIDVFSAALSSRPELFDEVKANEPGRDLHMRVPYPDDQDHFIVQTTLGPIRVRALEFHGVLQKSRTDIALEHFKKYSHAASGESISESASFPFTAFNMNLALEMHMVAESGITHVVLRKLDGPENSTTQAEVEH